MQARSPKVLSQRKCAGAVVVGPEEKTIIPPFDGGVIAGQAVEVRLKALESKLDELLNRLKPGITPVGNSASKERDLFASNRAARERDDDVRRPADPQRRSIPELEVELKQAMIKDQMTEKLSKQKVISAAERELARSEVSLIKAMLQGRDDELADEIERLKLEIKTRTAARKKRPLRHKWQVASSHDIRV